MKKINKKVLIIIVFIILILILIYNKPYVIIEKENNEIEYFHKIKDDYEFYISSIHSVSKSKIIEKYIVDDKKINNIETIYMDQGGAGLPDIIEVDEFIYSDGYFKVSRDRILEELLLNTNSNSENVFYNENTSIELFSDVVNSKYEIKILDINLYQIVIYKLRMWINEI